MPGNLFRNGASLLRVIEDSPIDHLRQFLLQGDENFRPLHETVESVFAAELEEDVLRKQLLGSLNRLPGDLVEPVEMECRRVLVLAETKGPTSLQTILEQRLDHEAWQEFDDQPGDLARSLWAHVRHRREFDDAVSFKAIRSWRNAGRLFAAFNVDQDGKDQGFSSDDIDTDKLSAAIGRKIATSRPLTISLIDLPRVPDYPPSVLVIVRFAGRQTSVATHGERGERRQIFFLPQDEAILIYTPADERIEVAATRAAVRHAVAECFASATLGHDVSAKPLTSAVYETHRFLTSTDLPLPDVGGFTVLSAKVVDLELRIENWQTRLSVRTGGTTSMAGVIERYLDPGQVLRRALGASRVLMVVTYQRYGDDQESVLEIAISDGNRCSLNAERDPVIRNFGRKLLASWGIMRAFRDLDPAEAINLVSVMAELWDLDQTTQKGGYFSGRNIVTKLLEDARLIRRKEVEPQLIEEDVDGEVDGPTVPDRTIYTIDLDWMQERLVTTLKGIIDAPAPQEVTKSLIFLGRMRIDDTDVPCYLARGLATMKSFAAIDERLRSRSALGPGIVFTGSEVGTALIGSNVVVALVATREGMANIGADRDTIASAFRAGRSLARGGGAPELVVVENGTAARLHVPGRDPLDLFGENSVRAFRLLVDAAHRGAPGVRSGDLISGSSSAGFQQMVGARRWKVVQAYVESPGPRRWKLKGY